MHQLQATPPIEKRYQRDDAYRNCTVNQMLLYVLGAFDVQLHAPHRQLQQRSRSRYDEFSLF